jgi:predicted neutral ceramidase superfamily lipid hydrolase
MINYILTIAASTLAIMGYILYYRSIKETGIVFNRFVWIMASVTISLETITYCVISKDFVKSLYFIVCSICCILIAIKIWKWTSWAGTNRSQKYSLAFYSLSIAIWPVFDLPFIAHVLLLIAIPVSFYPVYVSAFKNYKTESSMPWLLWSISDLLVIIIIGFTMETVQELPYVIVSFICPFTVYAIIMYQRIRHSKIYVLSNAGLQKR